MAEYLRVQQDRSDRVEFVQTLLSVQFVIFFLLGTLGKKARQRLSFLFFIEQFQTSDVLISALEGFFCLQKVLSELVYETDEGALNSVLIPIFVLFRNISGLFHIRYENRQIFRFKQQLFIMLQV